jgi:Carbohydrate binding domain
MKIMLTFFKKNPEWLGLIAVYIFNLVIYRKWLFSYAVLTRGDWGYHTLSVLKTVRIQYFSPWLSDNSLGRVLIDAGQAPTYGLYGFLTKWFGFGFNIDERIVHFWPIVFLTPIFSFLFVRSLIKHPLAIFLGVIIIVYNNYFLTLQTGHLTLAGAYVFIPLSLFFLEKLFATKKILYSYLLALSFCFISFYEPRTLYVVSIIVILTTLYYIIQLILNKQYKVGLMLGLKVFGSILLALIVNFYWLIGIIKSDSASNNEIFDQGLFGSNFFNILNAMGLYHQYWTGGLPKVFELQPIPFYIWLVPITLFVGIFYVRKINKNYIQYIIVALAGILLTKQVGQPFPHLYTWLFEHFPGFRAFREASKFFILVVFSYSIIIPSVIEYFLGVKSTIYKKTNYIWAFVLIVIFLGNTLPFLNGSIGNLNVERNIPQDYVTYNSFIEKQNDYFRTLWVPKVPRWATYSQNQPVLDGSRLATDTLSKIAKENNLFSDSEISYQSIYILQQVYSKALLDSMSVKYVIVPIIDMQNDDNFYKDFTFDDDKIEDIFNYKEFRQVYIDTLNKIDYLKKIDIGTKDLIVYENSNFNQHFDTTDNLVSLSSLKNLDSKYRFITETLNKPFNITLNNNENASDSINYGFENIDQDSFIGDTIRESKNDNEETLFISNKQLIKSNLSNDKLIVYSVDMSTELALDLSYNQNKKILYQSTVQPNQKLYIQIGQKEFKVKQGDNILTELNENTNIKIYLEEDQNLIKNGSFEDGLWKEKVGDCNNFDDKPIIGMDIDNTNSSDGNKSLVLKSTRHQACTDQNIEIKNDYSYLLSFDYFSKKSENAFYNISLDNEELLGNKVPIIDRTKWSTYKKIINTEKGTNLSLSLSALASDGKVESTTSYDNVKINQLTLLSDLFIAKDKESYTKVPSTKDIVYNANYLGLKNLIKNGSFEDGLWKEKVGDCNNFDDKPIIGMDIDNTNSSDGNKSLVLKSTRHQACTDQNIEIKPQSRYILSFDYKISGGDKLSINLDYQNSFDKNLSKDIYDKSSKWKHYQTFITTPESANVVSLSLNSISKDDVSEVKTYYDNIKLVEVPNFDNFIFKVKTNKKILKVPEKVSFNNINFTEKIVQIDHAVTPFYLNLSESFSNGWVYSIKNGLSTADKFNVAEKYITNGHYSYNNKMNGWLIDPITICQNNNKCVKNNDGSFSFELTFEYFPQRWFNIGLVVSGTTFVALIIIAGVTSYKEKRRKKHEDSVSSVTPELGYTPEAKPKNKKIMF